MSTTKTDTTTGQFDPGSMNLFQNLMKSWGPLAQGFMNNPYGNQQFRTEQQLGTGQARNLSQGATSGLLQNMQASGMQGGATNPAGLEMLQNQQRANTGMQANLGFLAPTQAAQARQFGAMNLGAQFRPFQTGQSTTEKTSGLGTWLPQVAQFGLGAAMAPFTGGASLFGPLMSKVAHMGQAPGAQSGQGWLGAMQPSMSPVGLPSWFGAGVGQGGDVGALPTGGWGGVNMPPPPAPG